MKKCLSALAIVGVCIVLSSALGAAKEKIEVWVGHDSWVPYIMRFNEVQDEYEVEYLIQGSTDAFIASVAAGSPPDVFRTGSMLSLAARDLLVPLDPYIERDGVDLDGFIPGILHSLQWDGHTYALPLNGDTHMAFYNIDLFEAAGLDSDSPPAMWDELEAAAGRLNVEDGSGNLKQLGISWWAKDKQFTIFLYQEIDSVYNEDLTRVNVDTPEALDVVRWIVDSQNEVNGGHLNVQSFLAQHEGDRETAFINGGLAIVTNPPAMVTRMQTEAPGTRFGVFPLPTAPGGKHVNQSGGHRVVIPVGAKNPDGGWAFIKWLTSKESGLEFAEPGFSARYIGKPYQGIGQSMSARIDVNLEAPFYRDTPYWRDFAQEMIYSIDFPIHPTHELVMQILRENVEKSLNQEMAAAQALEIAQVEAQAELTTWMAGNE